MDTQPDAGYEVGAGYYRYLGSSTNKLGVETLNDAYTYVRVEPNDEGKYIFKLEHPNTLYEVIVDYVKPGEEQEAAQQDPASSKVPLRRKLMNALKKIASVFSAKEEKINLDDLDDGFNLGGRLDEGNENLKNDPAAEEKDPAKEFVIIDKKEDVPEDKSHKLKLNNPSINNPLSENVPNRLLTWQVNAEGKSLDTVYEGQSIRFIGNCKKGQELKKLTIKYYYYNENHSKTDTEATIEANGLEKRVCANCGEEETRETYWDAEATRQIQFVVSGSMHYVLHADGSDYSIFRDNTPAVLWYPNRPLTFSVALHPTWKGDCIVSANGKELKPDANGVYTLPGGTDFVIVNCDPVGATATGSDGETHSGTCPFCGKIHPSSFWGRIVALVHTIFYFFKNRFKK